MKQFWDPIFCSGDKRGLKEATVMSTNTKRYPFLVFLSGGTLLPDDNLKLFRVFRRKKLEDHYFGLFRHTSEFKLHADGDDNHGSFAQRKSDIIKKTL